MTGKQPILFPRTPGHPLVSVMIPSRDRPKWLCEAVDSCVSLAGNKEHLQFVFKIDSDDQETYNVVTHISSLFPKGYVKILSSPRGRGYLDMQTWVDWMCRASDGDWLFLFNDDARIKTEQWDLLLAGADLNGVWHKVPEVCILNAPTEGRVQPTEFIFMRRSAFEILGHFSGGPHCDNWAWQVFSFIGSAYFAPIAVEHQQDKEDKVRGEGHVHRLSTGPNFNSVEAIRARMEDAKKLLDFIERKRAGK